MRRAIAGAAGAALIALTLTACGSGDDSGDSNVADSPSSEATEEAATTGDTAVAESTEEAEPAPEEAQAHSVTFRVTGPSTAGVTVGDGDQEIVNLPFEETTDLELSAGQSVSVTAATLEEGDITCEVEVDGDIVDQETDKNTCSASFVVSR